MRTTKLLIIALSLLASFLANAQQCDNVIFPGCPPGNGRIGNVFTSDTPLKNAPNCDEVLIIQNAIHGIVEYVGEGGNLQEFDMYNYTTNTNCEAEDNFTAVECCTDDTGITVCDTINYGLHLSFQCETPPDLFCCIANNDMPFIFEETDLLENDLVFIEETYPGFFPAEVFVSGIIELPANGTLEPNNEEIIYTPFSQFEGIDSIVYEVFYYLDNGIENIRICDEQTAYFIVEDCIRAVTDEVTVTAGDTIYFNPLANDYIAPETEDIPNLNCYNQLPQIVPASFFVAAPSPYLSVFQNGNTCFTAPQSGCFSYQYQVCNSVGMCEVGLINVKVEAAWDFCAPVINLGDSPLFSNTIHAQHGVITSGTVVPGADVSLKAGQGIRLDSGFKSGSNTNLRVIIEECTPE